VEDAKERYEQYELNIIDNVDIKNNGANVIRTISLTICQLLLDYFEQRKCCAFGIFTTKS